MTIREYRCAHCNCVTSKIEVSPINMKRKNTIELCGPCWDTFKSYEKRLNEKLSPYSSPNVPDFLRDIMNGGKF